MVAKPLRISPNEAAVLLGVSVDTVYTLVAKGVFTRLSPTGKSGRGKRFWLRPKEIEIYADQGEQAVAEFRRQHERGTKKASR